MTFVQRAMNAVFGQGKSKSARLRRELRDRLFPEGTRFRASNVATRQVLRARLRDEEYRNSAHAGLDRKSWRALSRAVAARRWKEQANIRPADI